MATITHTFPGTIVYSGVASVTPTSILAVNGSNQVGSTTLPIPPTLTNGQIYVGTSTPSTIAAVTPTTNGGVSGINANTANIISNGNTTTFNIKVDETSQPQLRGLGYDIPINTVVTQPSPQVNQWTQVLNYDVSASPGSFVLYSLATTNNSVYMVELNFNRIINATENSVTKQVFRITTDNLGAVTPVQLSASSNGVGASLGLVANREATVTTGANIANFNVTRLASASKLVGTVTVTSAFA